MPPSSGGNLDIANGSLAELGYILRFAGDLGLIPEDQGIEFSKLRTRAAIVTWKLYESLGN